MVKEPRPGRVKTRLGREIGMTNAALWYRHQTVRLLRRLDDPRWELVLAVSPDGASRRCHAWPARFRRIPQGSGDLGQRMSRALRVSRGPCVLIGSDIPGIEKSHIAAAFLGLGASESVVGPAFDGGFWLVGLRHPARASKSLFEAVRWSHPKTLSDTVPTLPQPVHYVETLSDVDDANDLVKQLQRDLPATA